MFAVVPFFEPFRLINENVTTGARQSLRSQVPCFLASILVTALLIVIVIRMLRHPYGLHHYGLAQLLIAVGTFGAVVVAIALFQAYRDKGPMNPSAAIRGVPGAAPRFCRCFRSWRSFTSPLACAMRSRPLAMLRFATICKNMRRSKSDRPFRGYATTIWLDNPARSAGPNQAGLNDAGRYYYGRDFFRARYGETFTETDLWRWNIPTFEEYGEWTSVQAHAFAVRLLAPAGTTTHSNYLRAFTIDADILRTLGVRYVLTDAETLETPAHFAEPSPHHAPRASTCLNSAMSIWEPTVRPGS